MGESTSLIDLKAISKPASKLIDAVTGAVGALYEPTRIRRKARAEADAAIIEALARAEIGDIESRALGRLLSRETRRQENIEAITRQAISQLPEEVSPTPVDQDWMIQFFENCSDVSNEEMQLLWAQILSGEVADPGAFSLRTLNTLKLLRRADAEDFFGLCSSLWQYRDSPIAVDATRLMEFRRVLHLQSIGLAETNLLNGYRIEAQDFSIKYHKREYHVTLASSEESLKLGIVALSASGAELASIVHAEANDSYLRDVVHEWRGMGHTVVEYDY
jgi:hypothetical protein